MSRNLLITNFLLFQAGWFALVLGGAYEKPMLGSLIAGLIILVHLWRANEFINEIKLIAIALGIGLLFESILVSTQLAQYSSGMIHPGLAPYWMVILWALFATTLNVSMYWIKHLKTLWISLLGGVLAPLTYYAGERLGAVVFNNPVHSLGAISLGWAVLFPFLVNFARSFNGFESGLEKGLPRTLAANRRSASV